MMSIVSCLMPCSCKLSCFSLSGIWYWFLTFFHKQFSDMIKFVQGSQPSKERTFILNDFIANKAFPLIQQVKGNETGYHPLL